MLIPLTAVAIAITQLLLPVIFSTDGELAVDIGRWFLFTIVLVIGLELNYGLLLGTTTSPSTTSCAWPSRG